MFGKSKKAKPAPVVKKPLPRKLGKSRNSGGESQLAISPKAMMSVGGLLFYFFAIIIFLSFSRQGDLLNALYRMLVALMGWGTLFLPFIFFVAGNMLISPDWRLSKPSLLLGLIIFFVSSISLSQSGSIGREFWSSLAVLISFLGAAILCIVGIIISLIIISDMSLSDLLNIGTKAFNFMFRKPVKAEDELSNLLEAKLETQIEGDWQEKLKKTSTKHDEEIEKISDFAVKKDKSDSTSIDINALQVLPDQEERPWQYPPLSLLAPIKGGDANRGNIKENARIIVETLKSFGVDAKVADVNPGPTVTQYAIKLASGTKLTKITSLANDLALALAAKTGQIRIEAPIPGKSLVGIELPNLQPALVPFRQLIQDPGMKISDKKLLIALGLDVSGQTMSLDIAKMPHMLIAGATGSGKSVCINVLLISLLFRASPQEVKLILVDPKRVELSAYNGIPHLLTPVIVDPDQVLSALKWVVDEMEKRYKLLAESGVRDIISYNEMAGFMAMPYIVVVIDELADIMLFAPSEVEDAITKIAQKARAAGIHLVLATQRPSVDVITGLIKANVPARIAFNVSSMMDSRVILDSPGAEKLLGKGDMLYIPPDQAKPSRIQGAYVADSDIKRLTDFLRNNGSSAQYSDEVVTKYKGKNAKGSKISMDGDEEVDDLFDDSVRILCSDGKASASLLQRRLSIGYNRAARILDQLQAAGVISPAQGAKPREILIKSAEEFLAKRQ